MSDESFTERANKPSHIAYTVKDGKGDQSHWTKIGAAWPAKDDGLTLQLDAIPRDGVVQLRSREALERLRAERAQSPRQQQKHDQSPKQSPKQSH